MGDDKAKEPAGPATGKAPAIKPAPSAPLPSFIRPQRNTIDSLFEAVSVPSPPGKSAPAGMPSGASTSKPAPSPSLGPLLPDAAPTASASEPPLRSATLTGPAAAATEPSPFARKASPTATSSPTGVGTKAAAGKPESTLAAAARLGTAPATGASALGPKSPAAGSRPAGPANAPAPAASTSPAPPPDGPPAEGSLGLFPAHVAAQLGESPKTTLSPTSEGPLPDAVGGKAAVSLPRPGPRSLPPPPRSGTIAARPSPAQRSAATDAGGDTTALTSDDALEVLGSESDDSGVTSTFPRVPPESSPEAATPSTLGPMDTSALLAAIAADFLPPSASQSGAAASGSLRVANKGDAPANLDPVAHVGTRVAPDSDAADEAHPTGAWQQSVAIAVAAGVILLMVSAAVWRSATAAPATETGARADHSESSLSAAAASPSRWAEPFDRARLAAAHGPRAIAASDAPQAEQAHGTALAGVGDPAAPSDGSADAAAGAGAAIDGADLLGNADGAADIVALEDAALPADPDGAATEEGAAAAEALDDGLDPHAGGATPTSKDKPAPSKPKSGGKKSGKGKSTDSAPAPAPAPKKDPPASSSKPSPAPAATASSLLADAKSALSSGKADKAYKLAKESYSKGGGSDAAEVATEAACKKGDRAAAESMLKNVKLLRRGGVKNKCKAAGIKL